MALNRLWIPSPCYHSRGGAKVDLIVIHTAEGARTIEDLGHFFANGGNQVSSHAGADDKRGKIGEYVTRGNAAWTQAGANEEAVSLEMCGFASWSRSTWLNSHENMLRNCADWIAEEAKKFGIAVKELSSGQAQGAANGVCQHIDLGSWGGSHVDCGAGFPIDKVIEWAKGGGDAGSDGGPGRMSERLLNKGEGAKTIMAFPPGATRIRAYSNNHANLTFDWIGDGGAHPENGTMTPGYDNAPDWKIPPGVRGAVIKRNDDGANDVSVAVG